jgi:hypothetical protein
VLIEKGGGNSTTATVAASGGLCRRLANLDVMEKETLAREGRHWALPGQTTLPNWATPAGGASQRRVQLHGRSGVGRAKTGNA